MSSADRHRPVYHFSSDNWMNDPIPFFWNGEYHLFFQHNPNGAFWGTMHWGHAISRDLVRWTVQPIALAPTRGGPDQDGCFTGCIIQHDGIFYLFYTGIPQLQPLHQVQCLATSTDLISWNKHPSNPIIAQPPAGFGECFRDPHVWREQPGGPWSMAIGAALPADQGGTVLLYRSRNLLDWQYVQPVFAGEAAQIGRECECPDLFPLGDEWVLLTSCNHLAIDRTHWLIGAYADQQFTPRTVGVVDGGALYAAKTLCDDQGRRILWGWIHDRSVATLPLVAGWSGVLSLPRVLTRRPDGTLGQTPAPELESLRGTHRHFAGLRLSETTPLLLDGVRGDALEIDIRFAPTRADVFGVLVRCSPDEQERVEIVYDRSAQRLGNAPLTLAEDEGLELRIFVDRSVIEVFANERACHTLRVYPERDDCLSIGLFTRCGEVVVRSIDLWNMDQ